MTKVRLEELRDTAHRLGWNAAIRHAISVVQAWEKGEREITGELRRSICNPIRRSKERSKEKSKERSKDV